MHDTKDRLLDAAETLFADSGIAAASLRDITALAEANLAAVNYHFGGKDGLLQAVFDRRLRPVNESRLALLDGFEDAAAGAPLPVAQIVYANLAPAFRSLDEWGEGGQRFMRLVARIMADPSSSIHHAFVRQFDEVRRRFLGALGQSLPQLSATEIERRFHYTLAAMMHTFCWGQHIDCLCPAPREHRDVVLSSLIDFAVGGLGSEPGTTDLEELRRRSAHAAGAVS
jgi:AcrR family transcriptional regulator